MKLLKQIIIMSLSISTMLAVNVVNLEANSGKTTVSQEAKADHPYPPIPPDCVDIAYDDNVDHSWGYNLEKNYHGNNWQDLRVRFEPPPAAEGGLVREIRACFFVGNVMTFHINLVDVNTGVMVSSAPFKVGPKDGWEIMDVSGLGFVADGEFYAELVAESGYRAIWADESSPIDNRSQRRGSYSGPNWQDVNIDHFIRAVVQKGGPPPGPKVEVLLNGQEFTASQTLTFDVHVINGPNPVLADAIVWVSLPDGTIIRLLDMKGVPLSPNMNVIVPILNHHITTEPLGLYDAGALLIYHPGGIVSDVKLFQIVP
ncbi:MAG: hypothetical protein AB1414_15360 [bacterium]